MDLRNVWASLMTFVQEPVVPPIPCITSWNVETNVSQKIATVTMATLQYLRLVLLVWSHALLPSVSHANLEILVYQQTELDDAGSASWTSTTVWSNVEVSHLLWTSTTASSPASTLTADHVCAGRSVCLAWPRLVTAADMGDVDVSIILATSLSV